jgi:hypothetical protein
MKEVEETEAEVDAIRQLYIPVAKRATVLYFCLAELASVDPMYQFSLSWCVLPAVRTLLGSRRVSGGGLEQGMGAGMGVRMDGSASHTDGLCAHQSGPMCT